MADPRIARIERNIAKDDCGTASVYALADLRAWQEIAERHAPRSGYLCLKCQTVPYTCPDRTAADAALDRLDALWAGESRG